MYRPLIGQQDQQIRIYQIRHERRQVVVVADLDLLGRDDIVFVHNRHDLPLEQREQRVARVQVSLPIGEIGARQQRLGDDEVFLRKQLVPHLHELGLTDRGQHLLERDQRGFPVARRVQRLPAGDYRSRRDQRDLMTVVHEPGNLPRHAEHGRARQTVLAARQRVRANLDDQPFLRALCHVCVAPIL